MCYLLLFISHQGNLTASRKQEIVYMTKIAELKETLHKLEEDHGKYIITSVHIDMSMYMYVPYPVTLWAPSSGPICRDGLKARWWLQSIY